MKRGQNRSGSCLISGLSSKIQDEWSFTEEFKSLDSQRRCQERRLYRGADKSLARPTSRCILFDGENISFDSSLVYIYIYIVLIFLQL